MLSSSKKTNLRSVIAVDDASMGYASPGHISKFQYATYLAEKGKVAMGNLR